MRAEAARRLVAPMKNATAPVVVEPELLECLLGSEAQVVERATRRPDSNLTDSSGSSRAVVENGDLGSHATCVVKPHCTDSTLAWPDDSEVDEHFALMLACLTASKVFYVDARTFNHPGLLRGQRLAELELGTAATDWMDAESGFITDEQRVGGEHKKRIALIAHRARAAQLLARQRLLCEGGDTR